MQRCPASIELMWRFPNAQLQVHKVEKSMRSHYCGDITAELVDQQVQVAGWIHRRRDHGGVIFVDVRDREGLLQVVFDPDRAALFQRAEDLRSECVVIIEGRVRRRPTGTVNPELGTGEIEVLGQSLTLLSRAKPLPFPIDEFHAVGEEVRLKYRYIDLRRQEMTDRLKLRAKLCSLTRRYLENEGFLDLETPTLTKATPEGARDYLVPSRVQPGAFYALPQSPQLFKQLFMVAGFDRYYQIVKCYRDEDLRADRQPEFTQIDLEASFVDQTQVMALVEGLTKSLFAQLLAVELPEFPQMRYAEAMRRFGSDKPDLRIPLELVDVNDIVKDEAFKVFASAAQQPGGRVAALRAPGAGSMSRKELDQLPAFVKPYGAKGLAYIRVNNRSLGRDGLQSPIIKNLSDAALNAIVERTQAQDGDVIFFGADDAKIVNDSLGALRVKLGQDLQLVEPGWRPLWVVDFPMFERADGRWYACHHPFTSPVDDVATLAADPGAGKAHAYDFVLNGFEIGGGSIRIHDYAMQLQVLELLGIEQAQAQEQ